MTPEFNAKTQSAPYTVVCMQPTDKEFLSFLGMQAVAQLTLPPGKEHHLKERTLDDLKAHIDARMPIIAVYSARGEYVAHALLAYPIHDDVVQHMHHYPFRGSECTTAVIQSLYVLPKHRAKNINPEWVEKGHDPINLIFQAAKDLAIMQGHTRIMAKVAMDNKGSLKTFQKQGFDIQETRFDKFGRYVAHYLTCPLYAAPCLAPQPKNAVLFKEVLTPA